MIQGTMSGVGKSLITAGLCRILSQDGYTPAPFKSQNMALNSYVTADGREMGRAQVMQSHAAGLEPEYEMNPILLKPTGDTRSQVIVNGHPIGNMTAREYFAYKKCLIPEIEKAYSHLAGRYDPVIIEGAGSPAEINLKENDIVNMGLANLLDAPVLLVADIDRGGVFAQLLGTVMLLTDDERKRIKGFIINKFRGDPSLLDSGIKEIEDRTGIPVTGVIPWMPDLGLEDEDSLTDRFHRSARQGAKLLIAVIQLPHISNFSDFDPFEQNKDVSLFYTDDPADLEKADLIIIPGTKNTIGDMHFLKSSGLADKLCKLAGSVPILGICGGFQMLGEKIEDPEGVECSDPTAACGSDSSSGIRQSSEAAGLGLLPVHTILRPVKHQTRSSGVLNDGIQGIFSRLSGVSYEGYEIHAGESLGLHNPSPSLPVLVSTDRNIYGTYIHGFFDRAEITGSVLQSLAGQKKLKLDLSQQLDQRIFRESRYDRLASVLREHLDLNYIYGCLYP